MKKELGLIILGVIALGAALYFLVFKKKTSILGDPENQIIPGVESPQREDVINHNVVGEIIAPPTQAYMGEQVTPIITVQQGTQIKQIALNEIPSGAYIDASQTIHVPVDNVSQTPITQNPSLGSINVGTSGSIGAPYASDSLTAKGIPNDFSWVSPALRATNIDPAILQRAPAGGVSNEWLVTVGDDGRAYARETNNNWGTAVYVATPTGWQLFSGQPPATTPIGAYGDVKNTPYGYQYSQEYWNVHGGEILASGF
jgi:hypothetical protein